MIRIGDADIRCGIGCNVGYHIVIDAAVIGIEAHRNRDVGIECFKVTDGFLVNGRLHLVGVIFSPESDIDLSRVIKGFRQKKRRTVP